MTTNQKTEFKVGDLINYKFEENSYLYKYVSSTSGERFLLPPLKGQTLLVTKLGTNKDWGDSYVLISFLVIELSLVYDECRFAGPMEKYFRHVEKD